MSSIDNIDKNSRNCFMCALYENYLCNEEYGMHYKPSLNPHCLAKHDVDENGIVIPGFDRFITRDCHAPSYHKLLSKDSELRDALTLEDAYQVFAKKYMKS